MSADCFTFYKLDDGEIVGDAICDPETLPYNTPDGCSALLGTYSNLNGWIHDGNFVAYPEDARQRKIARPLYALHWSNSALAWIDPRTLADHQAAAWQRIKQRRDAEEFAPFTYGGYTWDGDAVAQRRLSPIISISKSAIAAGQPFSYPWKTENNLMVTLTAQDFVAMELAKVQQFGAAFIKAVGLYAQIYADTTTTPEQLDAIQWV